MTAEFPGFPSHAASFEAPLEMLDACHGRIRKQCATLLRVRSHVEANGMDAAASEAARGVIRYFDKAGPDHHADEEEDLFPALLEAVPGSDPVCIRELIESLTKEHRELARLWIPVRAWLASVEARETALPDASQIDPFVDLYERHAAREERELFPMAARLLGSPELERIGRSMRMRRGIASV